MSGASLAVASGALTGTTQLWNGSAAHLNSIQLVLDGTNAGTVTVYDSLTGTGKVMAALSGAATSTGRDIVYNAAVRVEIGMTVVVTGTGAVAYVTYNA